MCLGIVGAVGIVGPGDVVGAAGTVGAGGDLTTTVEGTARTTVVASTRPFFATFAARSPKRLRK